MENMKKSKASQSQSQASPEIMKDFKKIVVDMTRDMLTTFPELATTLDSNLDKLLKNTDDENDSALVVVFQHCQKVFPDKFFDILYQNETLFTNETNNTEFLPGIDFKVLWKENISEKTRVTLWKYLQLLLFTIVSSISNGSSFGDTAKLFEAINEDEFKNKLEETIAQMQHVFDNNMNPNMNTHGNKNTDEDGGDSSPPPMPNINLGDLPNPQDIHEHVTKMMEGKLGKLAREIAEETAADLNINTENAESVNDVFQRLFKNPTKLMSLVKNVGGKLDEKLKSGDINETELLKEASELMQQMKNMPGMQSMLNKMGMGGGGGGGGGKMNMNATQANLDRNIKMNTQKERMRAKLATKQAQQAQQAQAVQQAQQAQQQAQAAQEQAPPTNLVFSTGEKVEKSMKKPNKKKNKNKN